MTRRIALLTHESRPELRDTAEAVALKFEEAGIEPVWANAPVDLDGVELILVIGGDGTILRAAELAREAGVPILGINYGHVGFLAEVEPSSLPEVVRAVINRNWTVDTRMTIDVITEHKGITKTGWALNEVSIEKGPSSRMIEVDVGVDGRGLSSFKTDTVLFSTPTGSTAYNFSGGGPIVWPDVEALIFTPIAAHALFARPLVVGPASTLEVQMRSDDATIWCDGRRTMLAPEGSTITAVKGRLPIKLARLNDSPFSGRLVAKFHLPVEGWRTRR